MLKSNKDEKIYYYIVSLMNLIILGLHFRIVNQLSFSTIISYLTH